MKPIPIITILLLIANALWCQEYENGAFNSLAEFKNSTPVFGDLFEVSKRSQGDIKATGGSDYKILSSDPSVSKKIIRKKIWGIVVNDTLYLNGIPLTGLHWYAKIELFGRYCFLRPAFPVNQNIQNELGLNDSQYGYMFGGVGGGIQGAKSAMKRIPLLYDIKTGKSMILAEPNMVNILLGYPELSSEFENEPDKQDEKVLLDYLVRLNELASATGANIR